MKAYSPKRSNCVMIKSGKEAKKVFRMISDALCEFYGQQGMYFAGETEKHVNGTTTVREVDFDPERKRYRHSIFSDFPESTCRQEGDEYVTRTGEAPLHARVNVLYNSTRERLDYLPDADYPQTPARIREVSFTVFFDTTDKTQAQKDRDRFKAFLENEGSRNI